MVRQFNDPRHGGTASSRVAVAPTTMIFRKLVLGEALIMKFKIGVNLLLGAISYVGLALPVNAADAHPPLPSIAVRDGQHDFDFNVGVWKTRIKRILDPLSGSTRSIELNGTVTVRKVWDGRAELEEIEADGPNGHWEGLSTFLYNPQAHQWSQSFID